MDDLQDLARRQRRERDRHGKSIQAPDRVSYARERGSILRLLPGWLPVAIGTLAAIAGAVWNAVIEDRNPAAADPARRAAISSPADWVLPDDYPPASIRAEEEGTVAISWDIARDGRVTSCRIDRSSGYPRLDAAACRAIVTRGRYAPASERRTASRRVVWRLPD